MRRLCLLPAAYLTVLMIVFNFVGPGAGNTDVESPALILITWQQEVNYDWAKNFETSG